MVDGMVDFHPIHQVGGVSMEGADLVTTPPAVEDSVRVCDLHLP